MFRCLRTGLVALILCTFWAVAASAQTDTRLAIGGSVTSNVATSAAIGDSASVGFELRLGHETEGWGWHVSLFDWVGTTVQQQLRPDVAGSPGTLRVRPVMGGYGYTWIRGRTAITTDVMGGYAFNSFHLDSAAAAEYGRLAASDIHADATNTFALRPETTVWYDLNRRFGIKVTAGYLITRPTISIRSSLGVDSLPIRADSVVITFGVVYSII
jgi:hypothetical protein